MWFAGPSEAEAADPVDGWNSSRTRGDERIVATHGVRTGGNDCGRTNGSNDSGTGREPSRRAVVLAAAIALSGCAGTANRNRGGGDEDATTSVASTDGRNEPHPKPRREAVARGWEQDPSRESRQLPDIEVVNESDRGVTAYLAIYGPSWLVPRFRATVSLRGPVHAELPVRVTFPDVDVAGWGNVLFVETAGGLHGTHPWDGGSREGTWVHLRDDDIGFHVLSL